MSGRLMFDPLARPGPAATTGSMLGLWPEEARRSSYLPEDSSLKLV
jgi:hypothetical protein